MIPNSVRTALLIVGIILFPSFAADSLLKPRSGKFTLTDTDRSWWAFQPLKTPDFTRTSQPAPSRIDDLIAVELSARNLHMNPSADPRELVRRASFDLTGLPPSPEDVAAFSKNPSNDSWAQLIDRLLASPHYGERWGRHWLDLVRYAESNGYERDGAKPNAWRFRDYVIRSFNEDKPYDRFIREQLAGDEFADEILKGASANPDDWKQPLIATGFYRLHVWDDEPDSTVAAEYDDLDDILVTTSTAFLGVTLGCARCHDHKFDPFSQADYYSMLSFFRGIDPYGLHKTGGGGRGTGKIERPLVTPIGWKQFEAEKKQRVKDLEREVAQAADESRKKQLQSELDAARQNRGPFDYALAAIENGPKAKPTHILARGDPVSPRAEVSPAFPEIISATEANIPEPPHDAASSGRRRVLANWIANPQNPLTARVMVNRLWQHHFGVGIVATPDDFGRTGTPPSNPALLDYLASEFIASKWSIKRMHKLVMTSRAYRMSSRSDNVQARAMDEANTYLWRQNLRRLDAESIRDTMLAVSGALNPKQFGPSVFPTLSREVHGTQDSAGKGWTDSPADEQNRRSVYLVVKRALKIPILDCFDFANSTSATGLRNTTITAPQALMLLNDVFVQKQAEVFCARLQSECGKNTQAQIRRAFLLALQRSPNDLELAESERFLQQQKQTASEDKDAARVALTSLCRGILNLNELIYMD